MATWRCPNCATLQVEARRCFLCNRSATSCGTCVNFRRALVGGVGYCALDRRREPLSGAEQRACWSAAGQANGDWLQGLFDARESSPPAGESSPPAGGGLLDAGLAETGATAPPLTARRTRGGLIEVSGS